MLRHSTDLSDSDCDVIDPPLHVACPLGRARCLRDVVNGTFFVLRGDVPWRLLSMDLPSKSTVHNDISASCDGDLFAGIDHHLVMLNRGRVERDASTLAAVVDDQSVRSAESSGP